MNNEKMGNRKRCYQFNYCDWNYKARYKKAHGLHSRGNFPFDLWVNYVIQFADYYAELYEIEYNRGYIEIREEGGASYVMAREADRGL